MGGPRNKTSRTAKGTFAPGSSGNPGGRPKGVAARIREQTNDGEEMIQKFLGTMRGEELSDVVTSQGIVQIGPSAKEKLDASKWLGDRLWGKAPDRIEISEVEQRAERFRSMSRDELAAAILEIKAQLDAARKDES